MTQMDFLRLAVEILERLKVSYAIVGSNASIAYGEARFTQDIDIEVSLELAHLPALLAAFPEPEFYRSEAAARDAIRTRFQFNVIHPASGHKIDFVMARTDSWGLASRSRRRAARLLPERDVMIAAPEDVIIGKLWYYSEGGGDRHLRDIAGILRVTGDGVDRSEVERWAAELGYLEVWRQVVDTSDRRETQ